MIKNVKVKAPPRLELGLEDLESFVLPLHHRAPSGIHLSLPFIVAEFIISKFKAWPLKKTPTSGRSKKQ